MDRCLPSTVRRTAVNRSSFLPEGGASASSGRLCFFVEGDVFPTLNGFNIGSAAHTLKYKDVIELAGVKLEFLSTLAT